MEIRIRAHTHTHTDAHTNSPHTLQTTKLLRSNWGLLPQSVTCTCPPRCSPAEKHLRHYNFPFLFPVGSESPYSPYS